MHQRLWRLTMMAVLLASPYLVGCSREEAPPPAPIPEVAVVTVKPQRVVLTSELPGRTSAFLVAEIRPQVNGLLQKRLFAEGAHVKAGDVLYEIDPAPYEADVDKARASILVAKEAADQARANVDVSVAALKRHQAVLTLAKTNLHRYDKLVKTQTVSAMDHDKYASEVDVAESALQVAEAEVNTNRQAVEAAEAAIKQAEAAEKAAQINLDYTKIAAPISGRIGRSNVTVGAIATAYQPLALATIQQLDPMYVDVPQSTVELNRLRRSIANGRLEDNETEGVKIVLEDGTAYPQVGSLKFRDVTVDPTTGSVMLRIVVPNPDSILLPGMFVRAIVDEGVNQQAILVPQQAVSRDPKGNPYVMVVRNEKSKEGNKKDEGVVQQQAITTDRVIDAFWLVSSGLSEGDRVIVEGLQQARPGVEVHVVPFEVKDKRAAKPQSTAPTATPSK